jgi:methyl-accepting chemotaxis protein
MSSRRFRAGIRTRITVMVLIGAVLTTAVTLVIADISIQGYAIQQSQAQEQRNLNVAMLIQHSEFGQNISIDPSGNMVIDASKNYNDSSSANDYGRLSLNTSTAYVDQVRTLLGNNVAVSIYQCTNQVDQPSLDTTGKLCPRISTTLQHQTALGNGPREVNSSSSPISLSPTVLQDLGLQTGSNGVTARTATKTLQETLDGVQYLSIYQTLTDPSNHIIGVLSVSEPLTNLYALIDRTTVELIISGVVIMIGGIILSLLVASAIANTLQRAATQLGEASQELSRISDRQASASRQQVWAINAINQALQNLRETSTDVSHRTDQLAQIGTQVTMRRAEIAPNQFESIMSFMTRSVNDINNASRNQTSTVERMTSAMQAVIEIADQVSSSSTQTNDSAKRLDGVIIALEELVTGRSRRPARVADDARPERPRRGDRRQMGQDEMMLPSSRGQAMLPEAGYNTGGGRMPSRPAGAMRPMGSPSRPSAMGDYGEPYSGNYPSGYGGPQSRPPMDQGRNGR